MIKEANPQYIPIQIQEPSIDEMAYQSNDNNGLSDLFFAHAETLASLGFKALGHVRHPVPRTKQESFVSIWINPESKESVQLIGILTPYPLAMGLKRRDTLTVFRTEFTDGTSIVTSNGKNVSCFPRDLAIDSVRCRKVRDIALLYQLHQLRSQRDAGQRIPTLAKVTDPVSRLTMEHHDTFGRLVRLGYYKTTRTFSGYIPTFKGAYLMTYRLLFPFKQIQHYRKDRKATSELRALASRREITAVGRYARE